MAATELKKLFKIELDDEKGKGEIVLKKVIKFPLGNIHISSSYSAKYFHLDREESIFIDFEIKEDIENGYENNIELYNQDHCFATMEFGINCFGPSAKKNLDELRTITKAQNLSLRIKSTKRKFPDVRWEGEDAVKFQQAIEALLDLVSAPKALYQYIVKNDDSFEEIFRKTKQENVIEAKKVKQYLAKKEAEQKQIQHQVQKNHLIGLILWTIFLGVIILAVSAFVLFIVAFVKGGNEPDYGIMWWSVAISVVAALICFFKQLGNM